MAHQTAHKDQRWRSSPQPQPATRVETTAAIWKPMGWCLPELHRQILNPVGTHWPGGWESLPQHPRRPRPTSQKNGLDKADPSNNVSSYRTPRRPRHPRSTTGDAVNQQLDLECVRSPYRVRNLILSKIGHAHVRYNMHKTEQQTLWILVLARSFVVLGYREHVRAWKPPSTLGCK